MPMMQNNMFITLVITVPLNKVLISDWVRVNINNPVAHQRIYRQHVDRHLAFVGIVN
jgi:hypothetical protein